MRTDYSAMLRKALFGFPFLLVTVVCSSADAVITPEFDLPQVKVEFKTKVLGILPVTGELRDIRGSFVKPGSDQDFEFNITMCLYSLDTQNAERDRLLLSPLFFDAERFPSIRFNQIRVIATRDGEQYLLGELVLNGVSQTISLKLAELRSGDRYKPENLGAYRARTTINRSTFGLDALPLLVSDEVVITVYIERGLVDLTRAFLNTSSVSSGRFPGAPARRSTVFDWTAVTPNMIRR